MITEARKKWLLEHPNYFKEYMKKYYISHKDYFINYSKAHKYKRDYSTTSSNRKKCKKWRLNHPDKYIAMRKKYRLNNIEKIKEEKKLYRLKYPDRIREQTKRYRIKHKEKLKLSSKIYKYRKRCAGKLNLKTILSTYENNIKQYGILTCYLCLLPIQKNKDHLEHKTPLSRGGTNAKENLDIACQRCNCSKGNKTEEEYRTTLVK